MGRDFLFDDLNTYRSYKNCPIMVFDVTGKWNDGLGNQGGNERNRGHSDFPGHKDPDYNFDYTRADSWKTTPPQYPKYTYLHFLPLEKSESMVVDAIEKCNARDFELAMHYMQDFFSHYGQGFRADEIRIPKLTPILCLPPFLIIKHEYFKYAIMSVIIHQVYKYGDFGHAATSLYADKKSGSLHVPDDAWEYNDAFQQAVVRSQHWYDEWKKHCKCKSKGKKNIKHPNPRIINEAAPPQKTRNASPYEVQQEIIRLYIEQKIELEKGLQQHIGSNLPNIFISL